MSFLFLALLISPSRFLGSRMLTIRRCPAMGTAAAMHALTKTQTHSTITAGHVPSAHFHAEAFFAPAALTNGLQT